MNVYVGFNLLSRDVSKKTHRTAIKEVLHFLTASNDIRFTENDYLLTIKPNYNNDEMTLLKDSNFLHTSTFRLTVSENLTYNYMSFLRVCLECLMILKEYMPSKIYLSISTDSDVAQEIYGEITSDLPRRYLSNLKTMLDKGQYLQRYDIYDIVYLLRTYNSMKLVNLCLTILSKQPYRLLLSEMDISCIDKLADQEEHRKLASIIMAKCLKTSTRYSRLEYTKFDEPSILKSYLFQLKYSTNLYRVTFLIEKLTDANLDSAQMSKIDSAVHETIAKYLSNSYSNERWLRPYTIAILRYVMQRQNIKNLSQVVQLINKSSDMAEDMQNQPYRQTVEEFIVHFGDKCDGSRILSRVKEQSRMSNSKREPMHSSRQIYTKSTYIQS